MKFEIRTINEWLIVIVSFVLITMVINYFFDFTLVTSDGIWINLAPVPTAYALSHATINAIHVFSGESTSAIQIDRATLYVLIGILIYVFLGPWLFYQGFKKSVSKSDTGKPFYWYLGAMICLGSFMILPITLLSMKVAQNSLASANESRQLDHLRQELSEVSYAIAEYEILENGLSSDFSLNDIEIDGLTFTYELLTISSDTVVEIVGYNPENEKIRIIGEIRPYGDWVLKQRN